jgi:hypothetical protein
MPLFRRRRPDPALEERRARFIGVAAEIDLAQRALLAAIPTSRDAGVPLAQALAELGARLEAAEAGLRGWPPELQDERWDRCSGALAAARAEAERLRLEPGPLGFEPLNTRVGDVLHPLETFADVERELRRL